MNETILVPKEVNLSTLSQVDSLSPSNYKKLSIRNQRTKLINEYLNKDDPYVKGKEPGSSAYVKQSEQVFLRNSCINNIQFSVDKGKYIYLNPTYYNDCMVGNEDVLFCTDANIGDCCLFIDEGEKVIFSSGMIKLNFKEEKYKYYVMGFMRDVYFRAKLESKTPKGATIRHSGDAFLECEIPDCEEPWVYELMENLIKNIAYSEHAAGVKLRTTEELIENEIISKEYSYRNPSISQLWEKARLDSGIYSDTVFQITQNVLSYDNGYSSLQEFGFGLRRGPNLAKRDLGRSLQTDTYRKGYSVLIYPSDISSSGYIEKVSYLGARNPIWFLGEKSILFSSEGTIGKTFIVCDETMHFTTNFHGSIIYPLEKSQKLSKSIFLGLYLNYLRSSNVLTKMSVGGNGGSFAVGYWDNILIPNVSEEFMDKLAPYYDNKVELDPMTFNLSAITHSGIYELNKFLIKCKAELSQLCNDLKNDALKDEEEYRNLV